MKAVVSTPARGERLLELGAETLVYDVAHARGPFDLVLATAAVLDDLREGASAATQY